MLIVVVNTEIQCICTSSIVLLFYLKYSISLGITKYYKNILRDSIFLFTFIFCFGILKMFCRCESICISSTYITFSRIKFSNFVITFNTFNSHLTICFQIYYIWLVMLLSLSNHRGYLWFNHDFNLPFTQKYRQNHSLAITSKSISRHILVRSVIIDFTSRIRSTSFFYL